MKNPRFLQVVLFYDAVLQQIYADIPGLEERPYAEQIAEIIRDGFGSTHIIAHYMDAQGYEPQLVVANNPKSQVTWLKENGFGNALPEGWQRSVIKAQIDIFKPDVLYITPFAFDSGFIRTLAWRPAIVMGWCASDIPENTDWSEFDLIVSPLAGVHQQAVKQGARGAAYFCPGFPTRVYHEVAQIQPSYDVVFCGQWTENQHQQRNHYIDLIAQSADSGLFTCGLYISGQLDRLTPAVNRHQIGSRFGLGMYKALRSGRIVLDARGDIRLLSGQGKKDLAVKETSNMRIFETTGTGSFLLTEDYDNLNNWFKPGEEIETFRNETDLLEKIQYYLNHPIEREAIARRGLERCLKDHSMERRAGELDAILKKFIQTKQSATKDINRNASAPQEMTLDQVVDQAISCIESGQFAKAEQNLLQALQMAPQEPSLLVALGNVRMQKGDLEASHRDLLQASQIAPDFPKVFSSLGAVLALQGNNYEAQKALQQAVLIDPNDSDAQTLLNNLKQPSSIQPPASKSRLTFDEVSPQGTVQPPQAAAVAGQSATHELENYFPGAMFGDNVQIIGISNTAIGKGTVIADGVWLNVCIRDDAIRMRIGEHANIGRQNVISTAGYLEIGDYCLFAPQVYVADVDHIFSNIYLPVLAQGVTEGRKIIIEENCWLGIHAVVTGNLTVGRGSVVAANAVVIRDVPPFSVVAGIPARIIKMYNPQTGQWESIESPQDIERMQAIRQQVGLPDRQSYRQILRKNAQFSLPPILTGRGISL